MELEEINSQLRVSRLARMVRVNPDVRDHVVASHFTSITAHSDEEPPCLSVGVFTSVFSDDPTNRTTAVAGLAGNRMGPQAHDLVETRAPQGDCCATTWRHGDTRSCELISSSSDVKFSIRRHSPLLPRSGRVARGEISHRPHARRGHSIDQRSAGPTGSRIRPSARELE